MPTYESPALYIDFARLPPPQVIEEIDYEVLLGIYKAEVLSKNPKLEKAILLEQSPTNIILQAEAYGEMMVRARINAAARAVMLPFAVGADLDVLAAFYGVQRELIPVAGSNPLIFEPESDARFRRRVQMATEAFTTAGSEGAYIFHALAADPTIRDASAVAIDDKGGVKITIMNSGSDPLPTEAQLAAVRERLNRKNIKPLTDVVSVGSVEVLHTTIDAQLTLYPGPNA
ncbi:MAG: baseplate J/gp47 family protein, partial [Aeromicrobium sp.]